jgi:tetratricopeptide (TPR) repeat protein
LARQDYLLATLAPFTSKTPPVEVAKATGIALAQVELWPLAAYALKQAVEQFDGLSVQEQAETLAFLGYALGQAGRPAFDILEQAKALNPTSALPLYFHGIYLRQQGALRAAEDLFNQAIALDSENAAIYVELARTQAEQGNFAAAEESYIIAASLAEDDLQIQLARLRFYVGRGYKMAEAGIPAAEKIITIDEDNAEAHDLLGWMQFLTGDATQAEITLRRAIELDPELVSARYHLARYLNSSGQSTAALAEYQHVVDWDTAGVFREAALKEMQRLGN